LTTPHFPRDANRIQKDKEGGPQLLAGGQPKELKPLSDFLPTASGLFVDATGGRVESGAATDANQEPLGAIPGLLGAKDDFDNE
jgi:hypothetical protein